MKNFLIVGLLFLGSGCKANKAIDAESIYPLVQIVCERHDAYVNADDSLTMEAKTFYLNSSRELMELLDAAKADPVEPPVEPPTE